MTDQHNKLYKKQSETFSNDEKFLDMVDQILDEEFNYLTIDDGSNYDLDTKTYIKKNDERFTNANELLNFNTGVNIFYISKDGAVISPSHSTQLKIYAFENEQIQKSILESKIVAFIQVDSWLYPLIPNETPIMKTNFDAYVFPNNDDSNPNFSFVGIKFTDEINDKKRSFFEDILSNYGGLVNQDSNNRSIPSILTPVKEVKLYSDNNHFQPIHKENENNVKSSNENNKDGLVSSKIISGANLVSKSVEKTANYAGNFINKRGEQIKSKIEPRSQPVNVNSAIQGVFKNVRSGTEVPVKVSSYVTDKLSSIAGSATRKVTSKVSSGSKSSNGLLHMAGNGVKGVVLVQDSLENAAKTLSNNLRNQSVQIVDYKYGPGVAKVADDSIHSAYNVGRTIYNLKTFNVKKTLAKAARKEVINTVKSRLN